MHIKTSWTEHSAEKVLINQWKVRAERAERELTKTKVQVVMLEKVVRKSIDEIDLNPKHPLDMEAALYNIEVWLDDALSSLERVGYYNNE